MKPLISYYGGKQRLASKIVPLIPKHILYCEPFAGGLAVLFAKGRPQVSNAHYYHEVVNDLDERLINFYRVFQTRFAEFYQRIAFTPMSEAEYKKSKAILNDSSASDIDRAWAYYVNIQQSFANKLSAGWQRSRNLPAYNPACAWIKNISLLVDCYDRLAAVQIACTDAVKCIGQFDSKDAFFYCDPPYPGADQGHYEGYTEKDLQNLVDCLAEIKGQFILSNYNQRNITIPDSWRKLEIQATMTAARNADSSNNKRTEVLWMSQAREDISAQEKMEF